MTITTVKMLFLFILLPFLTLGGQTLSLDEIQASLDQEKSLTNDPAAQAAAEVWAEVQGLATELQSVQKAEMQFSSQAAEGASKLELTMPAELPAGSSLQALDASVAKQEELNAALDASLEKLDEANSEQEQGSARLNELSDLLASDRESLAEVSIPSEGESALEQALYQKMLFQKGLLQARIKSHQAEQAFLQKELAELPNRIRARKAHNTQLRARRTRLQEIIAKLRRQQASDTDKALKRSFDELSHIPQLAVIVSEVRALNERRTGGNGLQAQIKAATKYEKEMRSKSESIAAQQFNSKRKIELLERAGLGIDTETSLLLRRQRAALPKSNTLQRKLQSNVELAVRSQVALVDLGQLKGTSPLNSSTIAKLVEQYPEVEVAVSDTVTALKKTDAVVNDLLEQRMALIDSLIDEYGSLSSLLDSGNQQAELAIAHTTDYATYLDQRLLWSRSAQRWTLAEPAREILSLKELFSREKLLLAWTHIRSQWFPRFPAILFFGTAFLFSIVRRSSLREVEKTRSAAAMKRNCTSIRPTVETILSSGLLALTCPAFFFLLASLIHEPVAYRVGCLNAGLFLFVAGLLVRFSSKDHLFEAHFKFSPLKAERIRSILRLFIPILLPFVFLVGVTTSGGVGEGGRTIFLITMLIVIAMAHQLFHPKHSIVGDPEKATLLARASYLLAIALPLGFAVGAALGFFSSVLTLRGQVLATAGILLAAFLVTRFFMRWILVSRRRLAIRQALHKREATLAQRAREESGELASESEMPSLEEVKEQAVDVVAVEEQTIKLVKLGVYFSVAFSIFSIWSSSFTALSILDQKPLWPSAKVTPAAPSSSTAIPLSMGLPSSSLGETNTSEDLAALTELVSAAPNDFVSWQDLLLSILFFFLTFVAARNIPGLLSLAVFSRLRLGPGGNFAFTTIVRYFIVLTGVVLALNKIGITWDKVQWLAAAITLGIGFGLQEIFANFVAGLILLFERPIRLGDIVTVGDVSGKVTQIKIRATTIQQFNNRDLVVPNKDFITSQLTNWTLRDSVLRFDLPVGIGYDSDAHQAEAILLKLVQEHPHVLDDPAPQVIFNSFGASTLDFLIRGHVGQVGNLVSTQHELHFQIHDAFREAGIEMAFPQQDIHLKSLPEGFAVEAKS